MTLVSQGMAPQPSAFSSELGEHHIQSQQKRKGAPQPCPSSTLPVLGVTFAPTRPVGVARPAASPAVLAVELALTWRSVPFPQAQHLPPGVHGPAGAHVPAQHPRHQAAVLALRHGAVLQRGHGRGRPREQHPPDPVHRAHGALRAEHVRTPGRPAATPQAPQAAAELARAPGQRLLRWERWSLWSHSGRSGRCFLLHCSLCSLRGLRPQTGLWPEREQGVERPDRQGFCFSVAPACENGPLGGGAPGQSGQAVPGEVSRLEDAAGPQTGYP